MKRSLLALAFFAVASFGCISGCGRAYTGPIETGPEVSRSEILFMHNRERMINGKDLPTLAHDPVLEDRAQKWAEVMARRDSLTHSRLDLGPDYFTMGENIAMGYTSIDAVVRGWMDSTGHRKNILNRNFNRAGFGYAKRPDGRPYWCAQFGGK